MDNVHWGLRGRNAGMVSIRKVFDRTGILAIIGMATIWTAVHNQLMYPITFIYAKANTPSPVTLYLAYAALQLLTCAVIFAARKRIEGVLFSSPLRIGAVGALGIVGTLLIIVCDFSTPLSSLCVSAGVALFSLYAPTFFVFWATRISSLGDGTHRSGHTVVLAIVASYILFCLFTALRLLLDIHASVVGPLYPCLGTALAMAVTHAGNTQPTPTGAFSIKQLPLNVIVPSLVFVYLCALIITLLNPAASLSEYPARRSVLYALDALLFVLVCCIYLHSPNALKRCSMQTFAILSIYLVGAVLLTALGTIEPLGVGNFATITGKNAFDLFILLLILVSVHNKHVQPIGIVVVYYVVTLQVPHLISALLTSQGTLSLGQSVDGLSVLTPIVVAAFLVSAAANVILIFFVARTPKEQLDNDSLDGNHPVPATTFEQIQATWGLSNREVDIARLACTNASTAKIASSLCIAEGTVYTHLKRIYRKAGIHSRQELMDLVETLKSSF